MLGGLFHCLEHLSNWFAGSASWRTAFSLKKCVLHGHTVEQTAPKLILKLEIALSNVEESGYSRGFRTGSIANAVLSRSTFQ